jgi:2-desacetyl-2-hydroxyethyl bacteriochlorophyllide A dehydrogenase
MGETYAMAVITAPGEVGFQDKILPELSAHDVLIGIKAASICGSDLHIFKGKHPSAPLPVAVGHEVSGEVVRTGEAVSKVKIGDRVAVEPVIVCGECHFCKQGQYSLCLNISFQYRKGQGSFAPYFVAEEDWVHKLPENISYAEGALLEPLSVAIHAVKRGGVGLGQSVAVIGDGSIGMLIALASKVAGASNVFLVGIQEHRLNKALELGVTDAVNSLTLDPVDEIVQRTDQLGVDVAFEAVGLEATLVQSLQMLKKNGTAVVAGIFEEDDIRIPANLFIQREITLTGTQGYCWDFQAAVQLVEQEAIRLKELITHTLPLSDLQKGFETALARDSEAIKVVIQVD